MTRIGCSLEILVLYRTSSIQEANKEKIYRFFSYQKCRALARLEGLPSGRSSVFEVTPIDQFSGFKTQNLDFRWSVKLCFESGRCNPNPGPAQGEIVSALYTKQDSTETTLRVHLLNGFDLPGKEWESDVDGTRVRFVRIGVMPSVGPRPLLDPHVTPDGDEDEKDNGQGRREERRPEKTDSQRRS